MKAILIVSHGSHSPKTKQEVENLLTVLKERCGDMLIEYGFLEMTSPNIPEGIARCVDRGAQDITVVLNFLNSGKHVDEDIPRIIDEARRQFPDVAFHITEPVGQHKKISDLFLDMINQ